MSGIDFQAVREAVPLAQVLGLVGWSPSWVKGQARRGWCPIHSARPHGSRIFAVDGNRWYCHQCKRGGDCIDLYAACKGLSLFRAAAELCEMTGHPTPYREGGGLFVRRPRNRKRNGRGDAGGAPPQSSPEASR